MIRRICSFILALCVLGASVAFAAGGETGGLDNFKKKNTYSDGQYTDVQSTNTFASNVKAAYEFGIMQGYGTHFGLTDNITRLASIIIACRIHSIYNYGSNIIDSNYTGSTQERHLAYAAEHGIYCDFSSVSLPATRAEFAMILSSSLPDNALAAINRVDANAIPDVDDSVSFSDAIYRLYRAGVAIGSDSEGTFHPTSQITRGAACAIATRIMDPSLRKTITLAGDESEQQENTTLYVLMYHHFVEAEEDCNSVTSTAEGFREDLQWLVDHGYQFVLPRDLVSGEPLPEKAVMITMDDGYSSNYELAFPIMQEFNAKAVIALITAAISSYDWGMTWDMCREMVQSGLVEFGSHTHRSHSYKEAYGTHGIQRRPEESREEYEARIFSDLQTSIDLIESNLGEPVLYFAYPHGKVDSWAEDFIQENFKVSSDLEIQATSILGM